MEAKKLNDDLSLVFTKLAALSKPPAYDPASVRREEYRVLQDEHGSEGKDVDLVVRKADMSRLPSQLNGLISDISLIEKLKETRVFAASSRLWYEHWIELLNYRLGEGGIAQGEGMLITLDSDALSVWEREDSVQQQTQLLQNNFNSAAARYLWRPKVISSRLILIHSLAHALINQLVFECGYGLASLRERLYVEQGDDGEMSGFMIYTAPGDSEGSMGASASQRRSGAGGIGVPGRLVRMGEPDKLGEVLFKALNTVSRCGGDPICGEAVQHGGQGPDSLNLAACQSCLLLPETSCEEFNRFLDRSFLTGVLTDKTSGFFGGLN